MQNQVPPSEDKGPSEKHIRAGSLLCRVRSERGVHDQIRNRSLSFKQREYRLIELSWKQGSEAALRASGEASPLPGYGGGKDCVQLVDKQFSEQKLTPALHALSELFLALKSQGEVLKQKSIQKIAEISRRFRESAAARFAFETAAIFLLSKIEKKEPKILLSDFFLQKPRAPVDQATSSVISLSTSPELTLAERQNLALNAADDALKAGASALKIKCGTNWEEEHLLLQKLRQKRPKLYLRADFNQGLALMLQGSAPPVKECRNFEESLQTVESQLRKLNLQWVEDPGVPLKQVCTAIDEPFVQEIPDVQQLKSEGHSVAVIKPMVLGSVEQIALLESRTRSAKLRLCISHLFDGPHALRFYWALHQALPQAVSPAGLSEHPGLKAYEP